MPSNFLIYTEKPTQYVWALFNLTQPKQVATNDANNSLHGRFQSNATRVGCNVPQVLPVLSAIYFNLTQPVWVSTLTNMIPKTEPPTFQSNATRVGCNGSGWPSEPGLLSFQSNATRVGCNSKLAQTKQQVVMHFVQCLSAFLTIRNSQTLSTMAISYPFYIILGTKQPAKLCSLIIRTCSKQKYRHLTTRWRYIDFEIFVCFYFLV